MGGAATLEDIQGHAHTIATAVSSGNGKATIAAVPPDTRAFLADAGRQAFVSGLNEIFVIAGVTALVGAALSLLLIRARDLHDAETHAIRVPGPNAGQLADQAALAA
jgi:hypothetical protein